VGEPSGGEQAFPCGRGTFFQEGLEAQRWLYPAAQVGLAAAYVGKPVVGVGRHDHLAVRGTDETLLVAEAKPDLAVENRPALYLTRVPVSGQRAARIDQAVHDKVLAVTLERVADPVDRVMDQFSH
jgi:hypothetical protein